MIDLRVVNAKAILRSISVQPIRGFVPTSVLVTGEKFDRATEVQYNGVDATEFAIASSTRLIVRVPTSQLGKPFRDIKVLSPVSAAKQDAIISLGLTSPPKTISGIDRLVQNWVIIFLTTPGSDLFSPTSGGGGASIIGRPTDKSGKGVAADLAMAIEKTKNELLRLQSSNQAIPPSEKLLSSSLDKVEYDSASTVLSARVLVQNMLGDAAEVSLG
jgi:hypothetical protein